MTTENQEPAVTEPLEAGWYPHPDNPDQIRWWTGMGWGRVKGRVNRLAAAALIFAWLAPFGGVPAIVLGVMARQEIDDFGDSERGKGLAAWAIAIGVLNVLILVAGLVLLVVALTQDGGSTGNAAASCAPWEELEGYC